MQYVAPERLRVTQRFGDLVGRTCDVPTMILLEEPRAHVDPLGQPSEVDGRARAHLVAMRANEVDQTLHLTAGTALRDPPVAALGYSAQRRLLAATDPDGHRLLHRPGRQRDVLVVEELAREVGVLVGERVTHRVDTFVEQLAARGEIDTERFELGFDVTRADTDD